MGIISSSKKITATSRLVSSFKKTALTSRLIALLLAIAFMSVISIQYNLNAVSVISALVAIAFVGEAIFFHSKLTFVSALTFFQVLIISLIATTILDLYSINPEFMERGYYEFLGIQIISFAAIIITLLGNYLFSQGKLLPNVFVSYIIYDTVLVWSIINIKNIPYIYMAIISLIVVFLYISLRHFVYFRKESPFLLSSIPTQKEDTALKSNLVKNYPNFVWVNHDRDSRVLVFHDNHTIYTFLPITPEDTLTISKNELLADGEIITGLFDYLLEQSKAISKDLKINSKYFTPVLYSGKAQLKSDIVSVTIRKKRYPEQVLGKVSIVNKTGLDKLFKRYSKANNLPAKAIATIN